MIVFNEESFFEDFHGKDCVVFGFFFGYLEYFSKGALSDNFKKIEGGVAELEVSHELDGLLGLLHAWLWLHFIH